jgi:chromosomal replication initiator protein
METESKQLKVEISLTIDQVDKWCFTNGYVLTRMSKQLSKDQVQKEGIEGILNNVSKYTGVPVEDIIKKTRKREIVIPRQLAQSIARLRTKYSLAYIGKQIGNKNHATVLNSAQTITNLIDTSSEFCETYKELIELYGLK